MSGEGPLADTTVVDFTQAIAGPLATRVLVELGARVIKIESPRGDIVRELQWPGQDTWGSTFGHGSGGKESIVVDLAKESGREIVDRLLQLADVVVENFRPGTLERFGFAPEQLVRAPKHPVVCSVSGFGQGGDQADWSATDPIGQGISGMTHMIGMPGERPFLAANGIADSATAITAATAILAALLERAKTGRGQHIDVAIADTMVAFDCINNPLAAQEEGRRRTEPLGHDHPAVCPFGIFPASDGYVVIQGMGSGAASTWGRLCEAIDRDDLIDHPLSAREADRLVNRDFVNGAISDWTAARTREEILSLLRAAKVIIGPVLRPDEVVRLDLFRDRGLLQDVAAVDGSTAQMIGAPMATTGLARPTGRPPLMGEHTRSVLEGDLGMTAERVDELFEAGVVTERDAWP